MFNSESDFQKAGRSSHMGVTLALAKVAGNLALASGITIALLAGIVFAFVTATIFILESPNPILGLAVAVIVSIIVTGKQIGRAHV